MTLKDGICDGCKDIGMSNCIACIQRRNSAESEKLGKKEGDSGRDTVVGHAKTGKEEKK